MPSWMSTRTNIRAEISTPLDVARVFLVGARVDLLCLQCWFPSPPGFVRASVPIFF